MDWTQILLFLHFLGLGMGSAAIIGSLVGMLVPAPAGVPSGPPPATGRIMGTVGRAGLVILIITGPLMLWARYGGFGGVNIWFHIKMLFVLLTIISVIGIGISARRAAGGDTAARGRLRTFVWLGAASLCLTVLSAVLAFN